jgi:hypothetical protein
MIAVAGQKLGKKRPRQNGRLHAFGGDSQSQGFLLTIAETNQQLPRSGIKIVK